MHNKIQQNPKPESFYNHYSNFDFSWLQKGSYSSNTAFINKNNPVLAFVDSIIPYYSGNELFCYPALTMKLRNLEYPIFKNAVKIDKSLSGIEFLNHFYTSAMETYHLFMEAKQTLTREVEKLVYDLGSNRHHPIIESWEPGSKENRYKNYVVIHGVKWKLVCHHYDYEYDDDAKENVTTYINLPLLLSLSHLDYYNIKIEHIPIGTSYIGIRLKKTSNHKGHVRWFDLNNGEEVTRKTALAKA